jgi:uncharacterized protein YqjF (DUF2071 family)
MNLAFIHWRVDAAALRPLLPDGLDLEEFDGSAWLGLVPFRMMIRPRFCPPVPGLSYFPELNVRTYVTVEDKPGVWFFSLDAANAAAVWGARRFFHLPYYRARMRCRPSGAGIEYESEREGGHASFEGRYGPVGDVYAATPGSLDHWLTERYCLYAADADGAIYRGDIHHAPWPLQRGELKCTQQTMFEPIGVRVSDEPALLHFVRRIDVVIWHLERLSTNA